MREYILLIALFHIFEAAKAWETIVESKKESGSEVFEVMSLNDFLMDDDEMISAQDLKRYGQHKFEEKVEQIHSLLGSRKRTNKENILNARKREPKLKLSLDLDYNEETVRGQSRRFNIYRIRHHRPLHRPRRDNSPDPDEPVNVTMTMGIVHSTEPPEKDDYFALRADYYQDLVEEDSKNDTYLPSPHKENNKFEKIPFLNKHKDRNGTSLNVTLCERDSWKSGYGPWALFCIIKETTKTSLTGELRTRLITIIKFWTIAYLVVGTLMWISCGYCCCCLFCTVFKPDILRQKVKEYVVDNPPGKLVEKDGTLTEYKPSDYEVEAYKQLELKSFTFI